MRATTRQESAATCSVHDGMRQLGAMFPRVIRGLARHTSPVSAENVPRKLGRRHCAVLDLLGDAPKSVGQLARELGLGLATVSGLVSDLDRAGLVQRRQDPADRRRTIVTIGEEHRPAVEAWLDGVSAPIGRVLEQLSAEERAVFVRAMDMLGRELAQPAPH